MIKAIIIAMTPMTRTRIMIAGDNRYGSGYYQEFDTLITLFY